jgi:monoamine oxidase
MRRLALASGLVASTLGLALNPDTPRPRDVVIVGAGMAGLAAAACLRREGLDCAVLEGRERAGGRVWSVSIGETMTEDNTGPCTHSSASCGCAHVELGAQWVHNLTDANPVFHLAKRKGHAVTETSCDDEPGPDVSLYDGTLRRWLTPAERDAAFAEWHRLQAVMASGNLSEPHTTATHSTDHDSMGLAFRRAAVDPAPISVPAAARAMYLRVASWCLDRVGIAYVRESTCM